MGTSGTGHDRCPSLVFRAHQAPGDWKIIKTGICFKGFDKIFRLRRDGTAASVKEADLPRHGGSRSELRMPLTEPIR